MSSQVLAALINKLQAPLIVSDILTGEDKEDSTQYALSTLISDMKPDAAILAIALSMRTIVAPYLEASPSLQVTEVECARLIEDYIQSWTTTPLDENTDPATAIDILEDAIDDLEYLQELLDLNMNFLHCKDECGAELCFLLKSQAAAQKTIAEQIIYAIETGHETTDEGQTTTICDEQSNNIVTFPFNN